MSELSHSVIQHINAASAIISNAQETLIQESGGAWSTYFMSSGDAGDILKNFPDLKLPAVVMYLKDIVFDDNPRACFSLVAVVCTDMYDDPAEMTVNTVCESVIRAIDGLEYNDASYSIYSSKQIKIDGTILAYELIFSVKDH